MTRHRNPDERLRKLERLAAQGDEEAAERLAHERARAGIPPAAATPPAQAAATSYVIRSAKGREVVRGSAVRAILRAVDHDMRLQPLGGTSVEDAQGDAVAEVSCGSDLSSPGGIVVELADGTQVDLSATESDREAGDLLRAALPPDALEPPTMTVKNPDDALRAAHRAWLANKDDPETELRFEGERARAGLPTWRFAAAKTVRAALARGKKITGEQARDIVRSALKSKGWRRDEQAGKGTHSEVWIAPSELFRVTFLRANLVYEVGGRGKWRKDPRIHTYGEPLSTIDHAMRLGSTKRYEQDPLAKNPGKKGGKPKLKGRPLIVGPLPAFLFGPDRYMLWLARTAADKKAVERVIRDPKPRDKIPAFFDGRPIGGPGTLEVFLRTPLRRKHLYGGLMFRVTDKTLIVSHMVVETKARRRGLNTQMIETIKKEFPGREVLFYDLTPEGDDFRKAFGGGVSKTNPGSDSRRRAAERGGDRTRVLLERLRRGEVTKGRLRFAAWLGDADAKQVAGVWRPKGPPRPKWMSKPRFLVERAASILMGEGPSPSGLLLPPLAHRAVVRVAARAALRAQPTSGYRASQFAVRAARAAETWAQDPTLQNARAADFASEAEELLAGTGSIATDLGLFSARAAANAVAAPNPVGAVAAALSFAGDAAFYDRAGSPEAARRREVQRQANDLIALLTGDPLP